jgi:hypothetical protein
LDGNERGETVKTRKIDEKHHAELINFKGEPTIVLAKTTNGTIIPEDEPTILFRGRDRLAVPMLEFYYQLCKNDGATDYQLGTMDFMINKFKQFSVDNPQTMKQPGITRGL